MDKEDIECLFPPQPEEPLESDCCGSGCNPCVFEIYQKQLAEWKKQCDLIINNRELSAGFLIDPDELLLSQTKFSPFLLTYIEQNAHNTFLYSFQAVKVKSNLDADKCDGKECIHMKISLNIKIGQHLVMKGTNENGSTLTRAYTPISGLELTSVGCFKTLVKLYKDGKMSRVIHNLKIGDLVEWRGPYGDFQYLPNRHKHLLMICAGTGIAPMYPIAKSVVADDSDETYIRLLFACRDFKDILLRNEIQELALYWNFSAEIYLSQAKEVQSETRYNETVRKGKISIDVINKELVGKNLERVYVLVCGTKSFNKDVINFLKQSHLPDENIHLF